MKIECVIAGCSRKVETRWCICGEHFRIVPDDLRGELVRSYNPNLDVHEQAAGFRLALAEIDGWVRETFGVEDRRPRPSWEQLKRWVRDRDEARARRRAAEPTRPTGPHLRLVP